MNGAEVEVAVVGGGLAGLSAAAELDRLGRECVVLEAGPELGGVAQSSARDGFVFERGPNTFRVPGAARAFFERHGLKSAIEAAQPASRKRFLYRGGELVPVPGGPTSFATTPLLSARGKLRLLSEPFVAGGDGRAESVAEFTSRRLGGEACEALVGPFLTGVYAGDEHRLGAEAVFPALVEAERSKGSILRGLWAARRRPKGLPGSWSGRGGAGALVRALAARLPVPPRVGAPCRAVVADEHGVRLEMDDQVLRVRAAVVATSAPAAARLLRPNQPDLSASLEAIEYAPIVNASFGAAVGTTERGIEGFGFLVPRGELEALLGCLFPSQLFAGRAPAGQELLTAFAGGTRRPDLLDRDDASLFAALEDDLDRALGWREMPQRLEVTRWREAIPQPGRSHRTQIDDLERRAISRGLVFAGGYLRGVSVADTLLSGEHAATRVQERLGGGGVRGGE